MTDGAVDPAWESTEFFAWLAEHDQTRETVDYLRQLEASGASDVEVQARALQAAAFPGLTQRRIADGGH